MAVIVRKRKGENIGSLIFRFGRKMKQSGVLKNVKKKRFRARPANKRKRRSSALYRLKRQRKRKSMALREKLNQELILAQKAHDALKTDTLRLVSAAIHNQEIEKRVKADKPNLTEEEILSVFKKEAKKRKEAIQIYGSGGRPDLAQKEAAELKILEEYLPPELNESEIKKVVLKVIQELNARGSKDFNRVMPEAMKILKNQADASVISRLIKIALDK